MHIFAITSPPSGVHTFAWPANFRNFAPKPCIFSHTTPVWWSRAAARGGERGRVLKPGLLVHSGTCGLSIIQWVLISGSLSYTDS